MCPERARNEGSTGPSRLRTDRSGGESITEELIGTDFNLGTTPSQKWEAVPKRARIEGS